MGQSLMGRLTSWVVDIVVVVDVEVVDVGGGCGGGGCGSHSQTPWLGPSMGIYQGVQR